MPRTGQKVTVVVGGGVESKFSVQLRPKLNNTGEKNTKEILKLSEIVLRLGG